MTELGAAHAGTRSAGTSERIDDRALAAGTDLLRALGSPHRLAIVLALADGPRCVHELVDHLGISQSLASQHLRVLRQTGLATASRRGKETAYALADEHVAHIARDALAHGAEVPDLAPPQRTSIAVEKPNRAITGARR